MSIPAAEVPAPGKAQSRNPIQDWLDHDSDDCQIIDDDNDCQVLEPINARPLAYAYPLPSTLADPTNQAASDVAGKRVGSRKRAGGDTSDAGTSKAGTKKQKTQKKPGDKPRNTKQPPTTDE